MLCFFPPIFLGARTVQRIPQDDWRTAVSGSVAWNNLVPDFCPHHVLLRVVVLRFWYAFGDLAVGREEVWVVFTSI